ncbi:MAG TPA: ferrous iron transporter B [Thiopseudomonas sp.]|nr:ferrous iron transporter B [Thiopseudomonas sp.]
MAIGVTSLSMVRDELFVTMAETQQHLEEFLDARDIEQLLQKTVANLQQIKGILSLVELTGAELLAEEARTLALDIPVAATDARNDQFTAINNALHVLRNYLERLETDWVEMPELLLPAINKLRTAGRQALLPESYFFAARLDAQRPVESEPAEITAEDKQRVRRLRHAYQTGLLAYLRDENPTANLHLMKRALVHLDRLYSGHEDSHLYWVAAAALESQADAQLFAKQARKQLFARVDREIKLQTESLEYLAPRGLIKDLLYLVALAESDGEIAQQVHRSTNLPTLPFTDHMLEEEYQRLSGPSQSVLRSLSIAILEEVVVAKELLDLVERGAVQNEVLNKLLNVLAKLEKTLDMVSLLGASNALKQHLTIVKSWKDNTAIESGAVLALADTLLYVEGVVSSMQRGEQQEANDLTEAEAFAKHQLLEARIVLHDEARNGLSMAKQAITEYLESDGDKSHLTDVPSSLQLVRGGLWFLDELRAAQQVAASADYIKTQMLEADQMPAEPQLETLADVLTSLEYYLEGGELVRAKSDRSVLDLADESLQALGVQV